MTAIYTRKAEISDLDAIMEIIKDAKLLLKEEDIPQWQDGYPSRAQFEHDIAYGRAYVAVVGKNEIAGVAALTTERQNNYEEIEDGAWENNVNNYVVIHRIALAQKFRGTNISSYMISSLITIGTQNGYKNFRLDTHPKNIRMQKLSEKFGFKKRGIIYVDEASDPIRYAYELNI